MTSISTKQTFKNLVKKICYILVGAIVGLIVRENYSYLKSKPSFKPYVAVVVATQRIDFPLPLEFLRGFEQEKKSKGKSFIEARNGCKVDIQTREDLGSVDQAVRVANELLSDKNCILVIGNSDSTLTEATLDVFLKSTDPPSYILPIATANDLITKAKTAGHGAVLRMVPDNANQAEVIQRLIVSLVRRPRVALYVDEENPVYSLNLSRDIASRVRSKGGSVVIEEKLGPSNSIYSSLPAWTSQKTPDVIVYVGVAHHGLLLIDQLSELKIGVPVIFTDGCMVGALQDNILRIPNRAFVLSPVGIGLQKDRMPTYEPIGRDAYTLASMLLSSSSDCTRAKLRNYITISHTKQQSISLDGVAGKYLFNADGNNEGMDYKVYEITGGKLLPILPT